MPRLTLESRIRLETLLKLPSVGVLGQVPLSKRLPKIAKLLGVSESTLHREVKDRGFTYDNYDAHIAHADSQKKVAFANTHYKYTEEQKQLILLHLREYYLKNQWSPNALLMRLKTELPSNIELPAVETVYQWVYEDSVSGGDLYKCLPRKHKKRKCRIAVSRELISNKVSIHLREPAVDERKRCGDLEIDSIVGPANKAGMLTVTDRKSRFTMASLVNNKSGDETLSKLLTLLLTHKKRIKTITSDNGIEFAKHLEIANKLNVMYYFADPYSSYQRGTNEHANGMIRRYFPKGTDFTTITERELQNAIYKINHLPRKIHGGKTAHEVYYGINKKLIPTKQRKTIAFAFRT
jgi:IS30 family transposase